MWSLLYLNTSYFWERRLFLLYMLDGIVCFMYKKNNKMECFFFCKENLLMIFFIFFGFKIKNKFFLEEKGKKFNYFLNFFFFWDYFFGLPFVWTFSCDSGNNHRECFGGSEMECNAECNATTADKQNLEMKSCCIFLWSNQDLESIPIDQFMNDFVRR